MSLGLLVLHVHGDWRTVSVYVGSDVAAQAREGSEIKPANQMDDDRPNHVHGQASQDSVITTLFKKKRGGYFVDMAANHPLFISNTRSLERDYGWKGLCVDGNENLIGDLARRRTCTVVNAVVASKQDEPVSFRSWLTSTWETGRSGIVGSTRDNAGPASVGASMWQRILRVLIC